MSFPFFSLSFLTAPYIFLSYFISLLCYLSFSPSPSFHLCLFLPPFSKSHFSKISYFSATLPCITQFIFPPVTLYFPLTLPFLFVLHSSISVSVFLQLLNLSCLKLNSLYAALPYMTPFHYSASHTPSSISSFPPGLSASIFLSLTFPSHLFNIFLTSILLPFPFRRSHIYTSDFRLQTYSPISAALRLSLSLSRLPFSHITRLSPHVRSPLDTCSLPLRSGGV